MAYLALLIEHEQVLSFWNGSCYVAATALAGSSQLASKDEAAMSE